jgi:hypothetical protein
MDKQEELKKALFEAMRSLETIAKLSGREFCPGTKIKTNMESILDVRQYAGSRARVAFDALEKFKTN